MLGVFGSRDGQGARGQEGGVRVGEKGNKPGRGGKKSSLLIQGGSGKRNTGLRMLHGKKGGRALRQKKSLNCLVKVVESITQQKG